MNGKTEAIRQIDDALDHYEGVRKKWERQPAPTTIPNEPYLAAPSDLLAEVVTRVSSTIHRLAPGGMACAETALLGVREGNVNMRVKVLVGVLRSLRADYESDRLKTLREIVRSDVFSDFLEMAEYLLNDEGLKDPAAVMAGSVLEQHIRKLCDKHGIPTTFVDGKGDTRPKKLDTMNADLAKVSAYGGNDQKQVTVWASIRNDAAHGNYGKYVKEQVVLMVQGIRGFLSRVPA